MIEIRMTPARDDNYAVLVHDTVSGATASIDAPEVEAIEDMLEETGWKLTDILVTHHHYDHIEGVKALKSRYGARVVCSEYDRARDRVPKVDLGVEDGDTLRLGTVPVVAVTVPGHTLGHVAFYIPSAPALFSGDTLFSLGCGRLFEGTPEQMWASLLKLRALDPAAAIYCGHEYTEANGRFALSVEPQNSALLQRVAEVRDLRLEGRPTLPTTLAQEIATNPFLRADTPELKAALGMSDRSDLEVFTELRSRKDHF